MNRQTIIWSLTVLVVAALVIVATQSAFVVRPDQFAIVTEFGDPTRDTIKEPGLYWKLPFVQEVRYLDRRVRGWDDLGKDVKTKELKPIDFTAFARWRIDPDSEGPLKYYKAVKTEDKAHANMDSVVTAQIQAKVREKRLGELVRSRGRQFETGENQGAAQSSDELRNLISRYEECNPLPACIVGSEDDAACTSRGGCLKPDTCDPPCGDNQVCIPGNSEIASQLAERSGTTNTGAEVTPQRGDIVQSILEESNAVLKSKFGIEILDLHFKYLNLSPTVHQDVIERIRADREADIATYRRVGKACNGSIQQTKEQRLGAVIGERDRRVRLENGLAQARAIEIKKEAFGQDPEFFQFVKLLEIYERGLKGGTRLVLSADTPFLDLLTGDTLTAKDLSALPVPSNLLNKGTGPRPAPSPAATP